MPWRHLLSVFEPYSPMSTKRSFGNLYQPMPAAPKRSIPYSSKIMFLNLLAFAVKCVFCLMPQHSWGSAISFWSLLQFFPNRLVCVCVCVCGGGGCITSVPSVPQCVAGIINSIMYKLVYPFQKHASSPVYESPVAKLWKENISTYYYKIDAKAVIFSAYYDPTLCLHVLNWGYAFVLVVLWHHFSAIFRQEQRCKIIWNWFSHAVENRRTLYWWVSWFWVPQ